MDVEAQVAAPSAVQPQNEYLLEGTKVERKIGQETLSIMTGVLAKQADGAVLVTYRDSAVLVASTTSKPWRESSFFPLTVDYREKTSAAGKFPGGFIKREGRPSQKEILTCRMIDRPTRPLFPDGFMDEVQVMGSVLSADPEFDPDMLAGIGAFASLHISRIPFHGAGGMVRVGRVDGEFILFPTYAQREKGELDLVVAGTEDAVGMVEAGAREVSEEVMLQGIEFAHAAIREIAAMVKELHSKVGKEKMSFESPSRNEELYEELKAEIWEELRGTILTQGKHAQKEALGALRERTLERRLGGVPADDPTRGDQERELKRLFSDVVSARVRRMALDEEIRADGRGLTDIRQIRIALGILPRVHGSAVFTRGETQSLTTITLGTQMDEQRVDGLRDQYSKHFYLDYNFPPFSVGECKPIRGPGRREIGHGMLAERALTPMLPDQEEFPYTIRVISEILESNGSSSMATVCAGSLAMMEAGVPLKKPVAGIAMGLISEGDTHRVLSDILGLEDHDGDMDFKVTGTRDGVTALQMDIKVEGLPFETLQRALAQAREGRLHILDAMNSIIAGPRSEMSPYAPRILRRMIPVDKIGALIGPGGKNIRMIQERTGTNVEVDDTGEVLISGRNPEALEEAAMFVDSFTKEVQLGEVFEASVLDIKDFGAFVEIYPGQEALCHVSELSDDYVEKVTDVVNVGDTIKVTVINVDPTGKVKVSAKTNPTVGGPPRGGDRPRGGPRDRGGPGRGGDRGRSGDRGRGPSDRSRGPGPGSRGPRGDRPPRDSDRPPRDSDRPPRNSASAEDPRSSGDGGGERGDEGRRRRRR